MKNNIKTITFNKEIQCNIRRNICRKTNIAINMNSKFDDNNYNDGDLFFLPGGMPGTGNLAAHMGLCTKIEEFNCNGRTIAAICAAPMILGGLGLLEGRKATIYPGMESFLKGAVYVDEKVVSDGNIITSMGPGTAMDFGLALVERLCGTAAAQKLREDLIFNI